MNVIILIVTLIILGIVGWLLTFIPMTETIKKLVTGIIVIIVVVVCIIFLLGLFGLNIPLNLK